jgi:DNA-directed RNA polymerase subunit RPC12/RpoP
LTTPPAERARFLIEPRAGERIFMRMVDMGMAQIGGRRFARYRCDRCGLETDWLAVRGPAEGEREVACRVCAKGNG